jgi:hypothetical protein
MPMNARLLRPLASGIPSPLAIANCVGWYDSLDLTAMAQNSDGTGAVAVGDQVGYWQDKSPTAAHVTQGTAANRPTVTASAVNGRAALVFDGSNDNLAKASGYTAQNSLAGLTRIMVASSSQNAISTTTFTSGPTIGFQLFNSQIYTYPASGVNVRVNGSMSLRAYASVFDGATASLNIYFNNALQSIAGTAGAIGSATGSGGSVLHIGSNGGSNNFHLGPIAEYIIYAKALSQGELTLVHAYLSRKWGL